MAEILENNVVKMDIKDNVRIAGIKRVITGRIPKDIDLLTGIEEICTEYGIKSGYIVGIIGSLKHGRMIYAIPQENQKIGIKYSDNTDIEGPLEVLSTQGTIGVSLEGALSIHLHMLVSDKYMRVFGGHFTKGGNEVLATAEFVIHELDGVQNTRMMDEETGFNLFFAK